MRALPDIVEEQFAALGIRIASLEVVRDFPWSRVLRLTTTDDRAVWAKRCGEGMAFEPELTRVVEEVGSSVLVPSLWIAGRWIATPHVPDQLTRGDDRLFAAVLQLQPELASLQRRLVPRLEQLRAVGTPTLARDDVEPLVERALWLCAAYERLQARPLGSAEVAALRRATPALVASFEVLEEAAPPTALLHLDLHHGNLFASRGQVRVLDWGDARIGSPLLHLVSTGSLLGFVGGADRSDPRIEAVTREFLAAAGIDEPAPRARAVMADPRLAAFIRLDALTAALADGSDEAIEPFADWLADLVRAAGAAEPQHAAGVRLA